MSLISGEEEHLTPRQRAKYATIDDILREEDGLLRLLQRLNCGDAILKGLKSVIRTNLHSTRTRQGDFRQDPYGVYFLTHASAFQKLGFAFDILKSPSSRRTYDRASKPTSSPQYSNRTNFLGGDQTFRSAVEAILHEFMTGDFAIVRGWLEALNARYPNLVSEEVVLTVERSFIRIRELVLTTRTYALLIYIELGRINRVQKRLMGLRYLDVVGRVRTTVYLVRVTLALPMRVDRALKAKEEKEWRAKSAGLQAAGLEPPMVERRAGILNDRVSKVLEFIVGEAGHDEEADEAWDAKMRTSTAS
ncbi:MAG: hypothetical protein M1827_002279 [Pycnora praestabilis]|nr:MAG: hypothetical protein M1827_002279 [Pycnora praestabilis]